MVRANMVTLIEEKKLEIPHHLFVSVQHMREGLFIRMQTIVIIEEDDCSATRTVSGQILRRVIAWERKPFFMLMYEPFLVCGLKDVLSI